MNVADSGMGGDGRVGTQNVAPSSEECQRDRENAMAYVPATNVLMVELRGTLFGEEVENTLYFAHTGSIDAGEVDNLFDWLEGTFLDELKEHISNSYAWDELYGTDLTTQTSPTYSRVFGSAITGELNTSPCLPGNICVCVSFRTSARGRSSRGRNYVSGIYEEGVTGNTLNTTLVNNIVASYELLLGGGTFPANWQWVVISRRGDGADRPAALIREITDVLSTDLTVDSQRGRLR